MARFGLNRTFLSHLLFVISTSYCNRLLTRGGLVVAWGEFCTLCCAQGRSFSVNIAQLSGEGRIPYGTELSRCPKSPCYGWWCQKHIQVTKSSAVNKQQSEVVTSYDRHLVTNRRSAAASWVRKEAYIKALETLLSTRKAWNARNGTRRSSKCNSRLTVRTAPRTSLLVVCCSLPLDCQNRIRCLGWY